jgi:hypothetical protein
MKTAIIMGIVALLGSAASATAALVVKDDAGSENERSHRPTKHEPPRTG